jgi:glycosyltransferase involved in cell wall biosynthesis
MLYFDVTDIVQYCSGHRRVSGIQRVQVKVIGALAAKHGDGVVQGIFFDRRVGGMVSFPASQVLCEAEFDSRLFLYRLGLLSQQRFPAKSDVKTKLRQFERKKIRRGIEKAKIYAAAYFVPHKLAEMGLELYRPPENIKRVQLRKVVQLDPTDRLVFLGSNWSFPELVDFGSRHKASGGVVTQMIYDLIPSVCPQYCLASVVETFNGFLETMGEYSTRYLSISESTKLDLLNYLDGSGASNPVNVVPLAHQFDGYDRNESSTEPSDSWLPQRVGDDFILCVGTIEIRKNGIALLDAWVKLNGVLQGRVPKLVFAGKYGWKIDDFQNKLNSSELLRKSVVIVDSPTDQDLAYLYQRCRFTVYPSHYEGWGLPVGEAAWFGRFTITSSTSSMPEVCGSLVDYVDPDNVQEIVAKVAHYVRNPSEVRDRELAIQAAPMRTWEDVADDIFAGVVA